MRRYGAQCNFIIDDVRPSRSRRTFFRALRPAVTPAAPLRSGCGSFPFLESGCRGEHEICNLCSYLVPLRLKFQVDPWSSTRRIGDRRSVFSIWRLYESHLNATPVRTIPIIATRQRSLSLAAITPAPCLVTVKLINISSLLARARLIRVTREAQSWNRAADFARSIDAFHRAASTSKIAARI